ncbi:MAG: hypothetical protein FWC20_01865 [Oscillospiraceae bacterium]|nr:hypothetical protein [Oscillospiraceae bacterium]MCL2278139.1 hypothetical protein [Oscillospiraceae bacterium]
MSKCNLYYDDGNPVEPDYDSIPTQNQKNLAAAAYHSFIEFMKQPNADAILEKESKKDA